MRLHPGARRVLLPTMVPAREGSSRRMPKKSRVAATKPAAKSKAAASTPATPLSSGHWLLKSEPDAFSWEQLVALGAKGEPWSGVRNYQARNFMRAMQVGDRCFFYHSNVGLDVVGIMEVMAPAHPDPSDGTGKWECVDVRALCPMPAPVPLAAIKANPRLAKMSLVTSFRLSVQPVTREEWDEVCRMGGLDPEKIRRKPTGAKTDRKAKL